MNYHEAVTWTMAKHPCFGVECERFESLGELYWRITVYAKDSAKRHAEYILVRKEK